MALSVDIRKELGSFRLDVRFEAEQGTPLALLGASGCGKSVTLRCIAGILKPDEGRITLDGTVLYDSAARIDLPPQRRRVGYLFQQYALFPNMTVRQNIAAAVPNRQERSVQTAELLRRFRLDEVASQRPWQLSGGQQQRCALARILASAPWMSPSPPWTAICRTSWRWNWRRRWSSFPARWSGSPTTGERSSATVPRCASWTGALPNR